MSRSRVQIALQDQVLRVTLCRLEKKNALTNAMYGALADATERAERDPEVRVVLIDAEGDAFTAGNDLGDFAAVAAGTMPRSEMRVQQFLSRLSSATKPYVAAVQGLSVGVGVTMLLHCDFVARPPKALRAMKQLLRQGDATAIAMARESEVVGARLQSSEAAEVFRAFAERRAPDFSSFT